MQLIGKRHDGTVHLRADAVIAHLSVHGIREIDRRRARAQAHDFARRREYEHFGGRKVDLEFVEEFARVFRLFLPVDHLAQPGDLAIERGIGLRAFFLIAPVRGDAVFAHAVHFFSTNLHFERTGGGTDDRGMQALVHIELRHGDIVFETARHGVPQRMHGAQNRVAVAHRFHDNAHRDEVVDLGEALAALRHLLIDGIQVLRAAGDMRVDDAHARQLGIERFDNGSQIRLAFVAAFGDQAADLLELHRLKVIKREVFKLPLNGADAQTVRDRRINLERLARLEDAAVFLQRAQGAHIVQAVGELDNDHANVLAHGNEHLAHSRRLLIGEALDFDARDFGDSLHKLGHLHAELLFKRCSRGVGVFDRVVKKGRA